MSGAFAARRNQAMNKLLMTALAASMAVGVGAANAQPNHNGRNDNDHRQPGQHQDRYDNNGYNNNKGDHRRDQWERQAQKRYSAGKYRAPHGYQVRQWAHGERLPASYRTRAYVIDYRQYGLAAPPRGYQYVRVGNDAYLSGANTGVVEAVIRMLFQ
jgi:Ni/Co efflux regulator RcnB